MATISLQSYVKYQEAARAYAEASEWYRRILDKDWQSERPTEISPPHSSVKLVIPIQYSSGGKNYWDSPERFNHKLAYVLAKTPEGAAAIGATLRLLVEERDALLIATKSDLSAVMEQIAAVEQAA